jgi:hypothetical protein
MDLLAGLLYPLWTLSLLLLLDRWRDLAAANQEHHHSQYRHEPHCFPILYSSGPLFVVPPRASY